MKLHSDLREFIELLNSRRVDFLVDEAWQGRIAVELDGLPVFFPDRATLLKNKRAAGRAKDLADADELDRRR